MSYLGGSIAFLWGLVQTWTGRANSAWGSSRVWNSGTSFESDVGTWQTRANTAYDSGTWGTGNTWQTDYNNEVTLYNNEVTAYNNALSPAAVDHLAASGASARQNFAFGLQTAATITFDRTGQWVVVARNDMADTSFGGDSHGRVHLIVNGVDVASSSIENGNANTFTGIPLGCLWQGSATSGQTASVQISNEDSGGGARNATGHIDAYFIPIQANPH